MKKLQIKSKLTLSRPPLTSATSFLVEDIYIYIYKLINTEHENYFPRSFFSVFFPAQLPFKTIDLIGGFEVLNGQDGLSKVKVLFHSRVYFSKQEKLKKKNM
jgi:hypothetical protein